MKVHTLKTAYADEVSDGAKTATVRYDNERDIEKGDRVVLVDAETGDVVAERLVVHVGKTTAGDALEMIRMFGAEYPARSNRELLATLRGHYGDEVGHGSWVDVIVYEEVDDEP